MDRIKPLFALSVLVTTGCLTVERHGFGIAVGFDPHGQQSERHLHYLTWERAMDASGSVVHVYNTTTANGLRVQRYVPLASNDCWVDLDGDGMINDDLSEFAGIGSTFHGPQRVAFTLLARGKTGLLSFMRRILVNASILNAGSRPALLPGTRAIRKRNPPT